MRYRTLGNAGVEVCRNQFWLLDDGRAELGERPAERLGRRLRGRRPRGRHQGRDQTRASTTSTTPTSTATAARNGCSSACCSGSSVKSTGLIIATKVGHFPGTAEHAYEPAHIRHQCEQSLVNLKRDYIDIYYFHHGDFGKDDRYLDQATRVMEDLKRSGKIRLIGLSAYSSNDFVRLIPKIQPDVLQSWANALDTQFIDPGSPVRTIMDQRNLPFVAFSPLAQGLLLGRYKPGQKVQFELGDHRKGSDRFEDKNLAQLQPKMEQLMARFGSAPDALARVALQYLLSFPTVGCVIPGFL